MLKMNLFLDSFQQINPSIEKNGSPGSRSDLGGGPRDAGRLLRRKPRDRRGQHAADRHRAHLHVEGRGPLPQAEAAGHLRLQGEQEGQVDG